MTGAERWATRVVPTTDLEPVVEALSSGRVVALPTETVYGLAARADLRQAVEAIFRAKDRPADNPLIVHAADTESALSLGTSVPDYARRLAELFWPGPVSLVLRSAREWPWVQAGHPTIAVRVPEPAYLREVIRRVGPLAAPSANRSGRPSPTSAEHCLRDLSGRIPLIVDGGPSPGGVESTVIDCTGSEPAILRPGPVTAEALREAIHGPSDGGEAHRGEPGSPEVASRGRPAASPGTRHPHYRPRARVVLVDDLTSVDAVDAMTIGPVLSRARHPRRWTTLQELARHLYAWFREADDLGVSTIYVERVDEAGLGAALMNRLAKAADAEEGRG